MKPGRIIALIIAVVLFAIPSLFMLIGGAVVTGGYIVESEDDGFFDETLDRIASGTAAVVTQDLDLRSDPKAADWFLEFIDPTVRIRAEAVREQTSLFVGIASVQDIESYIGGVTRDEIIDFEPNGDVDYNPLPGESATAGPPTDQTFWVASDTGSDPLEIEWDVEEGDWAAVLMNADGSVDIVADVTVGIRSSAILVAGLVLLAVGALFALLAVAIILVVVRGGREVVPDAERVDALADAVPSEEDPVSLNARIDEPLSPWMWLVKWFLAIPHLVVLGFLTVGFVLTTIVAGIAILFTGRYPRGAFDFNLGVLRWWWRVDYYAFHGGLGTDRYPPFSLQREEDYPATLDIEYPERLSQGLVLVKWWLLAIPHYLVLALLLTAGVWASSGRSDKWDGGDGIWTGGLLGLLVLIAAVILLFSGRYPRPLFALIIGLNRWVFRVMAYAVLMTDRYPPFRLDQGGLESDRPAAVPSPTAGSSDATSDPPPRM
jgi:hypothetical protein